MTDCKNNIKIDVTECKKANEEIMELSRKIINILQRKYSYSDMNSIVEITSKSAFIYDMP